MPCCGKKVRLPEGPGRVSKVDIFREEVVVDLEEGQQIALRGQRLTSTGQGPQTESEA